MPIKPENRARYPKNWKEIRQRILARAGNECEKCKAPNGQWIMRGAGKDAGTYMLWDGQVFSESTGERLGMARGSEYEVLRGVVIVLTIAHLDHTPENCGDYNLCAWCQKCHLAYDQEHHQANARATRRAKLAIGDLLEQSRDDAMDAYGWLA